MANTSYTDTALKIEQAIMGNESVRLSGSVCCGNVLMARGQFVTGGNAKDDVIKVTRLPKGAVVVPHLSKVISEGLGTSFTISIGDGSSTTRYASGMALATAGEVALSGGTAGLSPTPLESSDWVTATITALTGLSTGKKAQFWIAYIMP